MLSLAAPRRPASGDSEPQETQALTSMEVGAIIETASKTVAGDRFSVAVVDRRGELLGLWHRPGAMEHEDEVALSLARTGAFFSNDQKLLTSRTVRFISSIHFPPGVTNQPNGALYGIENTNRVSRKVSYNPGKEYPEPLNVAATGPSLGITTGKKDNLDSDPRAVNPGGVGIYKHGVVVGGIGVTGVRGVDAEFAAVQGSVPQAFPELGPPPRVLGVVFVGGISLPPRGLPGRPPRLLPGEFPNSGSYLVPPADGMPDPSGYLVGPTNSAELNLADVTRIVDQSHAAARRTRAVIRRPIGSRTKMVIGVSDLQGNILAVYRMFDSTIFSIDVAIAKARNVVYFSSQDRLPQELPGLPVGTAVTNRTISFGAQPLFPPGIDGTLPGPFLQLFLYDTEHPGTQGLQPPNGKQNGIVFFPGSVPLYRGGQLVGGLGISGDGVEQDDFVAYLGARGFYPPPAIRADQFRLRQGVRMPYLKFPRNPTR